MPNLLAHHLLVKRFPLKEKEFSEKYPNFDSFLKLNYEYLYLGTQGPDPLFYMGIIPFKGLHIPTALKKIGNKIHKMDGKKYFRYLIDTCHSIEIDGNGNNEQKKFEAFVFGQFAHYLLDRETHPYVLYMSGFDKNGKIKGKYHYEHAHFEAKIDYCLAKHYQMEHYLLKPEDAIPNRYGQLKVINNNLVPVLKKLFDEKRLPKKMYSNAVNNYYFWQKYSNHGSAMRVKLFGKTSLAATRIPSEVNEDVLNLKRETWRDPVTGENRNESFLELQQRAFDQLCALYEDIIKYGFNYETFSKYIDGKNYYGTLPDAKWVYNKENLK